MQRACGVLLPIFSLPGKYGIGCFSKEAYDFVDFLKKAGQTYWQILPLGPTSYGDSPYQAFSTFAGNPYFIDLDELIEKKLLTRKECDAVNWGYDIKDPVNDYVNYEALYLNRFRLLKKAYKKSNISSEKSFVSFCKKNAKWLDDYALYMALKDAHGSVSYLEWEEDIRLRKKDALLKWQDKLKDEIGFYKYIQYLFYTQWHRLKDYANKSGIKIVGDIPIYVSLDSADTWANPKLFQLKQDGFPERVAGCPPDYFAKDGQLWGNPLYDWDYHKKTGYKWWIERFRACFDMYDIVRVDHFRGFDAYYSIPAEDKNAKRGKWVKGPGFDLFKTVGESFKTMPVIAEDLGFITPSVKRLIKKCGYPGMKIMQYGFGVEESSEHAPHNYDKNLVIYTGTHDNDTITAWFNKGIKKKEKDYIRKYMNFKGNKDVAMRFIISGLSSVADTAIFPIQDYLGLGNEAKINTPSTLGDNWKWRLKENVLDDALALKMYDLALTYRRIPGLFKEEG